MTLKELYEQNPKWHDLPLVVYLEDGGYGYIGGAVMVYTDHAFACDSEDWEIHGCDDVEDCQKFEKGDACSCEKVEMVVVFAGN